LNQAIEDRRELRNIVADLEILLRYGSDGDRTTRLIEYLSGAGLSGRSGSSRDRENAYRLLELWIDYLVIVLDCKGLVLLIDEMEGLFSGALYWSIRSRRTAYRTLGYYASVGSKLRILAAFTPDGWYNLQEDAHANASYLTNQSSIVSGEDVPRLLRHLRAVQPHELTIFSESNFRKLLEGLKRLHAAARGYDLIVNGELTITTRSGLTPRIFSRSVISALEARWFQETLAVSETAGSSK
jgi:hypothetical protein